MSYAAVTVTVTVAGAGHEHDGAGGADETGGDDPEAAPEEGPDAELGLPLGLAEEPELGA